MRKNHSKIVYIKLAHLPYLYIYDARSHLHQMKLHVSAYNGHRQVSIPIVLRLPKPPAIAGGLGSPKKKYLYLYFGISYLFFT